LTAYLTHQGTYIVDCCLYGIYIAVKCGGQLRYCSAIALYCTHKKFPAIVIVEEVRQRQAAIAIIISPSIVSPSHKEEEEDYPDEPTAFTAKAILVVHHSHDHIRVKTSLLQQWCNQTKHSIGGIAFITKYISLCVTHFSKSF